MSEEDSSPKQQITIRAKGQARVNAVGTINNAESVHVGNRYENPCTLPPPVVENILYIPNRRDLDSWVDRALIQGELLQCVASKRLLVEVLALGGFGKSSLAVWVSEQTALQETKVIWVSLLQASRFNAFARWVLYELCVPTEDKMAATFLIDQLVFHLRKKRCLVIMDQLEAIAETEDRSFFEEFLTKWQRQGQHSTVLVTTRQSFFESKKIGRRVFVCRCRDLRCRRVLLF